MNAHLSRCASGVRQFFLLILAMFVGASLAQASLSVPESTAARVVSAGAVCRGTILGGASFRSYDGHIYTRTSVRVDEGFKGVFPSVVGMVHRGGTVGNTAESSSSAPDFTVADGVLLFLDRREDGTLFAMQGSQKLKRAQPQPDTSGPAPFVNADETLLSEVRAAASGTLGDDVTDQTAPSFALPRGAAVVSDGSGSTTGLVTYTIPQMGGDTYPGRFIQCDRGEAIPYLVDADFLPAGISQSQALAAVADAFAAWSAASSLKFKFEGLQSFGMPAADVSTLDGRIRVQLHDAYGFIDISDTLGEGGASATSVALGSHWGYGGAVNGQECHRMKRGYVVMKHTAAFFNANTVDFAEVLCHEIGHALGLAHSSNDSNEADPQLLGSVMFFQTAGGRGAVLNTYDQNEVRLLYPQNTVPYAFDRVMNITTHASSAPNVPSINEVELRGYDLQNTSLTLETRLGTGDTLVGATVPPDSILLGDFSEQSGKVKFTPAAADFGDASEEPGSGFSFANTYFRFSDGVNASPFNELRVISLHNDSFPAGASDGIPDYWQNLYFGNPNPTAVANAMPGDDFDNDGFTNLQEYRMGTDPKSATSRLNITSFASGTLNWQATPYELYEVQSSTDLVTWVIDHPAVVPTTGTGSRSVDTSAAHKFFRVKKVP